MQPREYMIEFRAKHGISREAMAKKLKISVKLLSMIEDNDQEVTHRDIVKRISAAYKLTREQRIMMLPPNYRPGPDYDPDRYKFPPTYDDALNFIGGGKRK